MQRDSKISSRHSLVYSRNFNFVAEVCPDDSLTRPLNVYPDLKFYYY